MYILRKSFPVFIIGLIIAFCTLDSSLVRASSANCKSKNISSLYEHCGAYPDGVHDLDCFGKHKVRTSKKDWQCEWAHGKHTSEKTYTLIIQQTAKGYCAVHQISGTSQKITLYEKFNLTAHVFEKSDPRKCSKAFFTGLPTNLVRCGPPGDMNFSRHSRKLEVNVNWRLEDKRLIQKYSLRYKPLDVPLWNKSSVQCQDGERCTVGNLNSSLAYEVQIQCVKNKNCAQCPWSKTHTVQPELTAQPVILKLEEGDIAQRQGCRLVSVTWKFPVTELVEGYNVTVRKASGEEALFKWMTTTQPEIRLVLSYSGYHLSIAAFNNASTSPAARQTIPPQEDMGNHGAGKLNVTLSSNTSLTLFWQDDLIKRYSCFSVEWSRRGHEVAHMSFFENTNNYKSISFKNDPLEPYKRYSITLHTRPNKDVCNMRHINESETTYGSTQFYFIEGSPVKAPANIRSYNVTLNSMVIQWLPVPEEDIRGFLSGYIIHYTEYQEEAERNVTVDPEPNSHELVGLKSGTAYLVQVSALTRAGAGVRSEASLFKTHSRANHTLSSIIAGFVVMAVGLIFASPLIKRTKALIWPSIPNPGNSNAMQKIEEPCELELLELINTDKLEQWDTNSLHIVEREPETNATGSVRSMPPYVLHDAEVEGNSESEPLSPDLSCNWTQTDTNNAGGLLSGVAAATSLTPGRQDCPRTPFSFPSDYTTMEMFQQGMPQSTSETTTVVSQATAEDTDPTVISPRMDYARQFSTSPTESSVECFL